MIVKKVPTSKLASPKSLAANVRDLADYIAGPRAGGDGEKAEHRGALNFLAIDHDGQVQEMIDLAEAARRDAKPVQHWILSWREGEQPTPAQADEAAKMFLDEMGVADHQAIYALHRDTHNWHLHLAINRVHPETEKLVTVNNGFDRDVAHRAIARIEHVQGWESEDRGLFRVLQNGQVERVRQRDERERKPSIRARDFEERVGERSAERAAIEVGAPAIRNARTWRELHETLAKQGMRLERKGSGAILWIGDQPVKASSAGRDCSLSALERRLGDFEPASDAARVKIRTLVQEPVMPRAPGWEQYRDARRHHYLDLSVERRQRPEQQREERRSLAARHQRERAELFRESWKGRGPLLNAIRSVLAARQAQEKAQQRDRQRLERGDQDRGRFPSFEEWLDQRDHDLGQAWRHRERRPPAIEGPTHERPAPQDIRAFGAVVEGWDVHYHRVREHGGPAFTDRGGEITIHDTGRRESVLGALQLGAQKWGSFTVHGNARFKELCVELAVEHGLNLTNPELQTAVAAERERIRTLRRDRQAGLEREGVEIPRARTPADVCRRHLEDVVREDQGRPIDPSRVDLELAVRMRVSGHRREEIARAIREVARASRPLERRDWDAYVHRTVGVAFGILGNRLAKRLSRDKDRLRQLEGRSRDGLERPPPRSRFPE